MALTKRWAGKAFGTNIGNIFVKLDGEDSALTGVLRMNEPGIGIAVYAVQGTFVAPTLTLSGQIQVPVEGVEFGQLIASGTMNAKGEIHGDWETTIGTGGTFVLYPHTGAEESGDGQAVAQFHTARYNFGAIEIDRAQFTEIAESLRRDFPSVVVTVVAGTEQARYLEDFKQLQFSADRAEIIKAFAQRPDGSGANEVVSVEFGPQVNFAMTQGTSEAWVLGRLETLKRDVGRYERTYITNFKRWGIGINQVMLLGAIIWLPSLPGLTARAVLMGVVLGLIVLVNFLHSRYVPFAAIYLRERKVGAVRRALPSIGSWAIGIAATIIAGLVGTYLEGRLQNHTPSAAEPVKISADKE